MKINRLRGFSLMEMMVVLLIVAIVLAATAPMVSKKMIRQNAAGTGDCKWEEFSGDVTGIYYGDNENTGAIVAIGRDTIPDNASDKGGLHLFGTPNQPRQIVFWDIDDDNNFNGINMYYAKNGFIVASTSPENNMGNFAVGIGTQPSGDYATSLGMHASASGDSSVAIGGATVGENAAGGIAIGEDATVSAVEGSSAENGIAIGEDATVSAVEGSSAENGIAIGNGAEASNTNCIAIGSGAKARYLNNIIIGQSDPDNTNTYNNAILIGNGITVTEDAATGSIVAIGHGIKDVRANEVALGTNTNKVKIRGDLEVDGDITVGGYIIGLGVGGEQSNDLKLGKKGTTVYVQLDPNGNAPIQLSDSGNNAVFAGDEYSSSDRRLKDVGKVFKGGLEELKKLEFYHYTFKNDKNKTPRVGVMAQDLQKVFPDAVKEGSDGFLTIRQEDMFYSIINAIKELDAKICALVDKVKANFDMIAKLQEKIENQAQEIVELKKQNAEFEKRLAKLEKKAK